MKRFLATVLLVLAFATPARATTIPPTDWISYSFNYFGSGQLDYVHHIGLWVVGQGYTSSHETYSCIGLFDLTGQTQGTFWYNVVISDFFPPEGEPYVNIPDLFRPAQVSTYIDDGVLDATDYGSGTPFAIVQFAQQRGYSFSFDVSDQVNAAIAGGHQWIAFGFNPLWEGPDWTTFTFGTPDNPYLALDGMAFAAMDASPGLYVTLGQQAFEAQDITPLLPEPASITLLAIGSLMFWRRR